MALKNEHGVTLKQENFSQEFVIIGFAPTAYEEAYDCENMSKASIRANAYKLLKNPAVAARIKQLRNDAAEHIAVTRDTIAQGYVELMHKSLKNGETRNYLKAAEQLSKLLGLDSPEQISLSGNGGFSINIIKPS